MAFQNPLSGLYTMKWIDDETNLVWFHGTRSEQPVFFLESTAFRPPLSTTYAPDTNYSVNAVFTVHHGYPVLDKIFDSHAGGLPTHIYSRSH